MHNTNTYKFTRNKKRPCFARGDFSIAAVYEDTAGEYEVPFGTKRVFVGEIEDAHYSDIMIVLLDYGKGLVNVGQYHRGKLRATRRKYYAGRLSKQVIHEIMTEYLDEVGVVNAF
jgi:hypothetical protein